jgi:hypothetical protein
MPYIVRDENGGERASEFIPESRDPYEGYRRRDIVDFDGWEDPYRKGNRSYEHWSEDLRNRERMLEEAQRMSEAIGSDRFEDAERVNQTREEMRVPYSEEEIYSRKWGLLNSLVDVIKAGGSKLGDFLYGDTDFGYMEGTEEARRRAAEAQRRRDMGY